MCTGTGPTRCLPETSRKRGCRWWTSQPGTSPYRTTVNGTTLTTADYEVTGDRRLASRWQAASRTRPERLRALRRGRVRERPVDRGVLVDLSALSTVGSTAATFAQGVHARRQAIGVHRSTGATQWRVLRTILADIARIAIPRPVSRWPVRSRVRSQRAGWLVFFGFRRPRGRRQRPHSAIRRWRLARPVRCPRRNGAVSTASPVSLLPSGDRTRTPDDESVDERQPSDD